MSDEKILVVDDMEDAATLTSLILEKSGYQAQHALSGESALELLKREKFDVVLLDVRMPGMGGVATLEHIKAELGSEAPVVIMVSSLEEEDIVESCLELGAHDYIRKPFQHRELNARIRSALKFVKSFREVRFAKDKLEVANEELRELARLDPLTNCCNRRHFFELANLEYERANRYNATVSMIMVDIDHFKSVNDRYGHAAGDHVIKWIGALCKRTSRKTDIVGRLGGEEFAVCCPNISLRKAEIFAERLRADCERQLHFFKKHKFSVTVSVGLAELRDSDKNIDALLERADCMLYRAKADGRNRFASIA